MGISGAQNVQIVFRLIEIVTGFHEPCMNRLVRRLRRIPHLPVPQCTGIIRQNRKAQPIVFHELLCFCFLSALFKNFLCRWSVRVNAEVCRKPLGGFVKRQTKKVGGKVDHVSVCAAGKAIIVIVCHEQAGVPVVVKRTEGFTISAQVLFKIFNIRTGTADILSG